MRRSLQPVAPVEFPPALRARLTRVGGTNLADRYRREAIFDAYRPKVAAALAADYLHAAGEQNRWYHVPEPFVAAGVRVASSWQDAHQHLHTLHGELSRAKLGRAFDEQEIRDYADNYSRICSRMGTLEHRSDFARSLGIEPPGGRGVTRGGACARLDDSQWWRRQLRRAWTRRAENVMREIGIVRKGREPYASDDAVMARAVMKAKGKRFLENHVAANEQGEQLSLLKLAEHSLANPALRRGEFMCRVRGFEEIARDAGHVAQFWTLTAPSAFHAHLSTGQKNPNFARQCVRDGQAWLCKMWARARAKLKRLSILFYGFRIAEPHHDGTPHWHLLLFARPRDVEAIERVVRWHWLSEYAEEKGASEYRAKCIEIDSSKGSAVGYIAKYVSKNIDGAGAIGESVDDETGGAVSVGVRRVDAWSSLHGIRQFQQVGGPPVGLWRELRRIRNPVECEAIERVRKAVSDEKDWAGFIRTLGGHASEPGQQMCVRPEDVEGMHGVDVLPGRVPAGGPVLGAVPMLRGWVLPESSGESSAEIDLERAARRVGCVAEKYRRTITRVPMIRFRRLAKRQWARKCGPVAAWDKRPATPEEMPRAWLDRAAARAIDRCGREVITETKYGETPAERAAGIVSFGLLGRFQSAATRPHRWQIKKCSNGESRNRQRAISQRPVKPPSADGGPASHPGFGSPSSIFSNLGPVAITVRAPVPAPARAGPS